jgi:hypothetical protein
MGIYTDVMVYTDMVVDSSNAFDHVYKPDEKLETFRLFIHSLFSLMVVLTKTGFGIKKDFLKAFLF